MRALKWVVGRLWAGWKRFAHALGVFNQYVLLTVFYWIVVNLTNVFLRLFRVDLLDRRMQPAPTYWHRKAAAVEGRNLYKHQF